MHNQSKLRFLKIGVVNFRNYCLRRVPGYFGKVFYKPVFVVMDITNKCNLRCRHCSIWSNSPGAAEMSTNQVKRLLSDLKKWLGTFHLGFCGGEPLLRKDLIDIIQFAEQNGIVTSIISNGVLLDERWAKQLLSCGLYSVTISLDGFTPQTHDSIRGVPGTFDRATAAVKHLKALKNRYDSKTRITINTVIMEPNLDELLGILNWVETNGLDEIWLAPLGENFGSAVNDADWFQKSNLWVRNLDKLDHVLNELIRRKENGAPINNTVSHLNSIRHYFRSACSVKSPICEAGITTIGISANGDIVLCPSMKPIGNVMRSALKEMWNSGRAKEIRNQIRTCEKVCGLRSCFHQKSLKEKISRFFGILKGLRA